MRLVDDVVLVWMMLCGRRNACHFLCLFLWDFVDLSGVLWYAFCMFIVWEVVDSGLCDRSVDVLSCICWTFGSWT